MTINIEETIYKYIIEYTQNYGHTPSYSNIIEGTGIASKSTIHRHIIKLIEEDKIYKHDGVLMLTNFKRMIENK